MPTAVEVQQQAAAVQRQFGELVLPESELAQIATLRADGVAEPTIANLYPLTVGSYSTQIEALLDQPADEKFSAELSRALSVLRSNDLPPELLGQVGELVPYEVPGQPSMRVRLMLGLSNREELNRMLAFVKILAGPMTVGVQTDPGRWSELSSHLTGVSVVIANLQVLRDESLRRREPPRTFSLSRSFARAAQLVKQKSGPRR